MAEHPQERLIERFKENLAESDSSLEHLQTHISHVFLTGPWAYKIKKPMNFGFLDFSSLDRRRHFCEEELRLNARLAPELYDSVLGLDADGKLIEANDNAEEFVIRMRRFDQADRLDHVARRIGLDEALVEQIADQIAAFHAKAEVAATETHFGEPDTVWAPMQQNLEQIAPLLETDADRDRLAEMERLSRTAFEAIRPTLEQRKREGHIRECHGDMHLANMALQDGAVTIFDGIEFNDDFRWTDTANDLAFALMDLNKRKLIAPARQLLNRYLEISGDYEALPTLRFYQGYRAAVRAKIALLSLRDGMPDEERDAAWADFREYTDLANAFFTPAKGELFITMGVSGSGKSLASRELVLGRGAIRVRSDAERQRMFTDPAERYTEMASDSTYNRLAEIARLGTQSGWPMAIDATFLERARRQQFETLADEIGVPYTILFIECDNEQLLEYLRERQAHGGDISEADEQVLQHQLQKLESLGPDEARHCVRLKCDTPFGPQIAERLG
ncbi:AAA family ATPase [Guyparkeria sp. GHLCS8-2]|uniref:bifunctional aminoglycoside phosphotransferase/ATP-binding protein n=1 Tax=Guyparkeria halopsychrophila TaxID=3139421 RepID=UPI0037C885A2